MYGENLILYLNIAIVIHTMFISSNTMLSFTLQILKVEKMDKYIV